MYKGTSHNSQGRLDRGTYRDAQAQAGHGQKITDRETEQNYKRALSDIESKLLLHSPGTTARKMYAQQKVKLQGERTAYLIKKNGGAHKANWDRINFLFRELVEARFGEDACAEIFAEAKASYAASCGLTVEQAFNISEAA